MTEAIELAGEWRGRMLHQLWSITGLGVHISRISVDAEETCHIYLKLDAHVAPLAILHGLLEGPRQWADEYGSVVMTGTYQGVPVMGGVDFRDAGSGTYAERTQAAIPLAKAALADLLAAIDTAGQVA